MAVIEVRKVFFNNRENRWDAQGMFTVRTENVLSIEWVAYSNFLEYDIYEVTFKGGGTRYTGPNGKDYILSYMR